MTDIKKSILVKGRLKLRVKLLLSAALLTFGALGLIGVREQAASAATPPDSCFAFNTTTGTITDYYDHEGNNSANPACPKAVDIPATIGGVGVTAIGVEAFRSKQLTAVSIPDSVTTIGDQAFRFNQITNLTLGNSVSTVGIYAFTDNQLTSVTIPSSVTSLGNFAFRNNQLTSVTFSANPATIGAEVLRNNPVETINYNGTAYTSATPNHESCFAFNAGTGTITNFRHADPAFIKSNSQACLDRDVIIPSTIGVTPVTTIGGSALSDNDLTSVTIPNSVTSLGFSAFSYNQLTSVTIPNSVTTIGINAFANNQLTTATIPLSIVSMGDSVFATNQFTSLPPYFSDPSITTMPTGIFSNNQFTNLTIPNNITNIGNSAFSDNQLTSITIPNTVTSIGNSAFARNQLTSVTIPNSVTIIGDGTFMYNQLSTIAIPDSVTSLGNSAFTQNQLTSATIGSAVTSIGNAAFSYNQLTEIIIPGTVTNIGHTAFYGNQLTEIIIPSSVTNISDSAFSNNQLTTATVANASANMGQYSFNENPLTSLTIGSNTYTEQHPTTDSACFYMSGTTVNGYYHNSPIIARDNGVLCGRDVSIPNGVTDIASWAMSYSMFTAVTIPDSVTTIGQEAFSFNKLADITIGNSVTSIGASAFRDNQLTSVTIPDSVTSLGNTAFFNNNLESAVISSGMTTIGTTVFARNNLTSVTIPNSVTTIGSGAFQLNNLASVNIPSSVSTIVDSAFSHQSPHGKAILDDLAAAPDAAAAQAILDSIFYTRLMLEDPSNPHDIKDQVNYRLDTPDYDRDGDTTESINFGGFIVNSASLNLNYRSQNNSNLQQSALFAGQLPGGEYIGSYRVNDGPSVPAPVDRLNPTPEELTAMQDALTVYYHLGDEVTFTPPSIAGYITPPTQTFVLGASDNEFSYVYGTEDSGTDTPVTPGGTDSDADDADIDGSLAETGMNLGLIATISSLMIILGASYFICNMKRKGMKL